MRSEPVPGLQDGAIIVVAPSPVARAGLAALLQQEGYGPVSQASTPAVLGSLSGTQRPAAVVAAPEAAGDVDALLEYLEPDPELRPVVVGPIPDPERLAAALAERPWAYLPGHVSAAALSAAIEAVRNNLIAFESGAGLAIRASQSAVPESMESDLTPREREVLLLVSLGLPNKSIAARLHISEHTAKFHVAAVLSKLGAATRADAVRIGASRGLLPL